MAGEGKLQHMEVDYSDTVDATLPQCEEMTARGKLNDAIEELQSLEKKTRLGGDMPSTSRILVAIVKLCRQRNEWDLLNEQLVKLSKKRSQIKQSVTKMVQAGCSYVDETPTAEVRLRLIQTLLTITEGKIYVEIERARLTRTLAEIKEREGDIDTAAEVLHELQVETFGSMEKREKTEFLLEQMRLCLAKKDFIRTGIISNKISTKVFQTADMRDLKLKYYRLMIEHGLHEDSFLKVSTYYYHVFSTFVDSGEADKARDTLKCVILFCVLAPYDNEQRDLTHRVKELKQTEELLTSYREILELFVKPELIVWRDASTMHGPSLRSDPSAPNVFDGSEAGETRWRKLHDRVVEHNIRVLAACYTRVRLDRMAKLLDLGVDRAEEFLSELVVAKTIYARLDRLDGVVVFQRPKDPATVLNQWSDDLNILMAHLNKITHLVNKEEMVHRPIP